MDEDAIGEPQLKVLKPIFPVLKPHVHDVPTGHRTRGASEKSKMGTIKGPGGSWTAIVPSTEKRRKIEDRH
jgi:hypothetical protein